MPVSSLPEARKVHLSKHDEQYTALRAWIGLTENARRGALRRPCRAGRPQRRPAPHTSHTRRLATCRRTPLGAGPLLTPSPAAAAATGGATGGSVRVWVWGGSCLEGRGLGRGGTGGVGQRGARCGWCIQEVEDVARFNLREQGWSMEEEGRRVGRGRGRCAGCELSKDGQ